MELKKICIRNFRSINDEEVTFNHNCLILLGKNEAGKSNVLKSIASVFGHYQISNKDKRKKIDNEKIDKDDYFVRAIISLSQKDFDEVENRFNNKFKGVENIVFSSSISLNDYIKKVFYNLIIQIKIADGEIPYFTFWNYSNQDVGLKSPVSLSGNNIVSVGGAEFNLRNEVFIIVKELYIETPINCHYWQYNDSFLLPSTVDVGTFMNKPSSYKALENIFQLCGRENIREEFENAKLEDGDYSNLLEQVSKKVTLTFQKIWNDFKGTSIQLLPDGTQILIKIAEKAKYNCEDRSDGFKKFISILLMLSTQSRAKKILENDLILIDEPDQSLYPTSAEYLRNELLEISKKSKVIYSTHSQYMIDSENLDRHIVVEKKDDITTLKNEDAKAPYTTDELLRRAIGASIFECIKPKNIVFEGFLDKKLFNKYCQFNKLEKDYKDYGQIYLAGISGVESVVSILLSANKKFIIVADSDSASKSRRMEFQKNYPDYRNSWLAYADVMPGISTMEDFINESLIEKEIKKNNKEFSYNTAKNSIQNIEIGVNNDKEKKQEIKNNLMEIIKKEDIKNDYSKFHEELKSKLKSIK